MPWTPLNRNRHLTYENLTISAKICQYQSSAVRSFIGYVGIVGWIFMFRFMQTKPEESTLNLEGWPTSLKLTKKGYKWEL